MVLIIYIVPLVRARLSGVCLVCVCVCVRFGGCDEDSHLSAIFRLNYSCEIVKCLLLYSHTAPPSTPHISSLRHSVSVVYNTFLDRWIQKQWFAE